jgi:NAD(P)-dependent dehydrogenase (short-subunit alcohol dehydrogenase family)
MTTYYKNFKNKTAIITGGASGLGAGIAKILAEQGAIISLIDINSSNLQKTKKTIDSIGNENSWYVCDVTNIEEVKKTISLIERDMQKIDILVNAAGVIGAGNLENLETSSLEDWDATYSINVKGTAIVCEEVASKMKKRNYGKIINISSHGGKYPNPDNPAYAASKAAVINLTQSFAMKWAKNNINVNVLCPGSIWTPMWEKNAEKTKQNDKSKSHMTPREIFLKFVDDNCPMQREQTTEDIGNAVAFFASDNSLNITGQSLNINGGTIMD